MISSTNTTCVNVNVTPEYYLKEYDDILMGKRRTYSSALMSKEQGPKMCAELLRNIFDKYLHWTPEEVRDCLNHETVQLMKLSPLIKRIPCPPEIDSSKELYYVAWYLYPQTRTVKEPELIIKLYADILSGKVKKFPSNYFDGNDGYLRARVLFLTMVREYLPPFENLDAMYSYFASSEGKACLAKYKLNVPLRELYGSALAYLHDSLSVYQRSEELYEKYNTITNRSNSSGGNYLPVSKSEQDAFFEESDSDTSAIFETEMNESESEIIVNMGEVNF